MRYWFSILVVSLCWIWLLLTLCKWLVAPLALVCTILLTVIAIPFLIVIVCYAAYVCWIGIKLIFGKEEDGQGEEGKDRKGRI